MQSDTKGLNRMKIFTKGQVVIPVHLRKKYHIEIGDYVEVSSETEGILIKPSNHGKKEKVFLTDQLFGIFKKYSSNKETPSRDDLTYATEEGFLEGWKE